MGTYILRRLLSLIPIIVGLSIIVFIIMRLLPGDVAGMILGGDEDGGGGASAEALEALRTQLGLDQPLYVQYFSWIWGLFTLDAGNSLWSGKPVFDEILGRLPLTLELAFLSLTISFIIAIPAGILSAYYQDSTLDYILRGLSIGGLATPSFWIATMLILGLTLWLGWTPPLGYVSIWQDPWANLQQLIWPALVIGASNSAMLMRMMRAAVLDVLREDYIRTAWSKGLASRVVLFRHALKNAMLPVITVAGIELGNLISGTVVMETIFTLPGIGRLLIDSITQRDYPVVQTLIILITVLTVMINLITDLCYRLFDPRIKYA